MQATTSRENPLELTNFVISLTNDEVKKSITRKPSQVKTN